MIIAKDNMKARSQSMARACIRFARNLRLTIVEDFERFTIKEALDDDDELWMKKDDITYEQYEEFIRYCIAYSTTTEKVPIARIMLRISCPNCNSCMMTPKQFKINTVECEEHFLICNNCGEILKLTEKVHIR